MTTRGQHTLAEINSQPEAWADALQAFAAREAELKRTWASLNPESPAGARRDGPAGEGDLRQVVFVGCGSTYYLSLTAAWLMQGLTGVSACAYPSSEIVLFESQVLTRPHNTLLVTVSRSGTTTETLIAVDRFRRLGGRAVWSITCYPDSPLARAADLVLPAEAGQEKSIAQTRSFASMLVLVQAMAAVLAGHDVSPLNALPGLGWKLLEQAAPVAQELANDPGVDSFFFLGSGPHYGIANEAMLKMKEMSLSHSEAFHFFEFRHGPKSMIDERALVVGLLSQPVHTQEEQVLDEMAALGGHTLALATWPGTNGGTRRLELAYHLPMWVTPVLYLPPLQLLAYYRAVGKGLDPDRPRNLEAVVSLNESSFSRG
jgi:glucosamine--fructose-6-phosphate aminotransferase (isomerizing)